VKYIYIFLLITAFTITVGCYSTYTGIYFIDRATQKPSVRPVNLENQITEVLKPFGFRVISMPYEFPNYVMFSHRQQETLPGFASLDGANSNISIAVNLRNLTITIRDFDHNKETEFILVVKKAIEQRLETQYGIEGLKFERQIDIF